MERLTYDFCIAGKHYWQVKGADDLECSEVCRSRDDEGCNGCPIANAFDRLAAIEDILGDDYDLDRLKELVEADREGRCAVTPCKQGDIVYIITEPQNVKGLDLGDVPDTEYEKKRVFECIVGSITIWDGGSHIQIILLHNGERVAHYIQPKDFKNGVVHFNRENAEAVLQNHKDQEKLPEAYQHQIMSRFCRKD